MSETATNQNQRYLVFSLAEEHYAVPLLQVKEVLGQTETTWVPYTPPHFKGIMNLRGHVISIIDLRQKFKMPKAENLPETTVMILDVASLSLGIIVDSVDSVVLFSKEELSDAPAIESNINSQYISGVGRKNNQLILILNIEKTLNVEDLRVLKNGANQAA